MKHLVNALISRRRELTVLGVAALVCVLLATIATIGDTPGVGLAGR